MCTPLACSDYYEASAPLGGPQPATDLPVRRTGCPTMRAATSGSHVPCVPIGQDGRPTLPRQPHRAYAADLRRGLLIRRLDGLRSRPPRIEEGRALHPGPNPPGFEPVQRLRGFARWFLAYAFWPCLPDPRRLAVPTRPVVVGAASRPSRRPPVRTAPSFYRTAATAQRWWSFTSTRSRRASWRTRRSLKLAG